MAVVNINNILHLKATVSFDGKTGGNPYRTIALPQSSTLYDLAKAVIDSFDFNFDHAFGFYDNLKNSYDSKTGYELFADIGEESKFPGVKNTKLSAVFKELKTKMLFLFDYGDEWYFIIELVKITDFEKKTKYPVIVDTFGEAPDQYGYDDDDDFEDDDFDDEDDDDDDDSGDDDDDDDLDYEDDYDDEEDFEDDDYEDEDDYDYEDDDEDKS